MAWPGCLHSPPQQGELNQVKAITVKTRAIFKPAQFLDPAVQRGVQVPVWVQHRGQEQMAGDGEERKAVINLKQHRQYTHRGPALWYVPQAYIITERKADMAV